MSVKKTLIWAVPIAVLLLVPAVWAMVYKPTF